MSGERTAGRGLPPGVGSPADAGPGTGRGARRLSAEDLSILALESETVAGHACKVIVLRGAPDLDLLRSSITGRLAWAPGLRMRLGEIDGALSWVPDPQMDVSAHVVRADAPGQVTRPGSGPRSRASSPSVWTARGRCGGST